MRRLIHRPSPSMLVSVLALVVATGGTSYAAVKITGHDIKDKTVTGKDVKNQALTGKDVKNQTLLAKDFKAGQLPAGPQGPTGPQGSPGSGRWVLINAAGQIEAQSGGFSVTAGYPTLAVTGTDPLGLRANGNVYINANEALTNNGIVATVVLQNTVDQNGDMIVNGRASTADANPEFSGEIAISQCGLPGTACAPPGTGNVNHLVVSPRMSDGTVTSTDTGRKRFYVIITGDSTDYVKPAA
jgi:hypothetical protein